jgi:hypothetical protein
MTAWLQWKPLSMLSRVLSSICSGVIDMMDLAPFRIYRKALGAANTPSIAIPRAAGG